jgi:hypothetical protein
MEAQASAKDRNKDALGERFENCDALGYRVELENSNCSTSLRRGFSTLESGRSPLVSIARASPGTRGRGRRRHDGFKRNQVGCPRICSIDAAKNETGLERNQSPLDSRLLRRRAVLVNARRHGVLYLDADSYHRASVRSAEIHSGRNSLSRAVNKGQSVGRRQTPCTSTD